MINTSNILRIMICCTNCSISNIWCCCCYCNSCCYNILNSSTICSSYCRSSSRKSTCYRRYGCKTHLRQSSISYQISYYKSDKSNKTNKSNKNNESIKADKSDKSNKYDKGDKNNKTGFITFIKIKLKKNKLFIKVKIM